MEISLRDSLLKRTIPMAVAVMTITGVMGQNLVPNPSFEDHSYCPADFNQGNLDIVKDWTQASKGTSDYFHACSRIVGVPDNSFGHQEAHDGEAYLGLITFAPAKKDYREYMQTKLTQALEPDQMYCVSFYISLADQSRFVTDGIGAYFSNNKVKSESYKRVAVQPQVMNPSHHVLDNAKSWFLLSDIYQAKGGERYLTLGNFNNDRSIDVKKRNLRTEEIISPWEYAYYYVDDLSVTPVDSRGECACSIPIIAADMKDSTRWKIPPGKEISFDNVLFRFDEDELDPKGMQQLNEVAAWMRNNDFLFLEVKGHTDIVGSEGYNDGLSQRRAERVISYLSGMGVDEARLSIQYYGSSKPVASNEDSEGRTQNRRVDFLILERSYEDYETDR